MNGIVPAACTYAMQCIVGILLLNLNKLDVICIASLNENNEVVALYTGNATKAFAKKSSAPRMLYRAYDFELIAEYFNEASRKAR